MIRCTIPAELAVQGIHHVVKRLREAGIPVRASGNDIRLCQVWDLPSDATMTDNGRLLGYGRLEQTADCFNRTVEFRYFPPADANVIDVEAREIIDTPLLPKS